MRQVLFIHGGEAFDSDEDYYTWLRSLEVDDPFDAQERKRWKHELAVELGDAYAVAFPRMPRSENAHYDEWAIAFGHLVPYCNEGIILIGHSLGAAFLTRYLDEHTLPVSVSQLHLVAGCWEAPNGFALDDELSNVERQVASLFIYHSQDDTVVPFTDAQRYEKALPKAALVSFTDRGHFLGESFPELVARIRARA